MHDKPCLRNPARPIQYNLEYVGADPNRRKEDIWHFPPRSRVNNFPTNDQSVAQVTDGTFRVGELAKQRITAGRCVCQWATVQYIADRNSAAESMSATCCTHAHCRSRFRGSGVPQRTHWQRRSSTRALGLSRQHRTQNDTEERNTDDGREPVGWHVRLFALLRSVGFPW